MNNNSDTQMDQLAARVAELEKLNEDFPRLLKCIEHLTVAVQSDTIEESVVSETLDLLGADQGSILLLTNSTNNESNATTLIRGGSNDAQILDELLHDLMVGQGAESQTIIVSSNLKDLWGKAPMPARYKGIGSYMIFPLRDGGVLRGIFNLIRMQDKPSFDEHDSRLLSALAFFFIQYIKLADNNRSLRAEATHLRKVVAQKYDLKELIGESNAIKEMLDMLLRVIPTDATVLIEGESGTGKELVAKMIHYQGNRQKKPFVALDCGTLQGELLESELFGHVKGAFTGAHKDKIGLLEKADGGTLFLDEIANLSVDTQQKFLRTLQEGEIRPVGGNTTKKVNVRVVAACNEDLSEAVENGEFRSDLYYRLNVIQFIIPPLRERDGDVALLSSYFLKQKCAFHSKQISGIDEEAQKLLASYHWPGNVRQLENIIERMVVLAPQSQSILDVNSVPADIRESAAKSVRPAIRSANKSIQEEKKELEKARLIEALEQNHWNNSAAAKSLGVTEHYVRYNMKKHGIKKPGK